MVAISGLCIPKYPHKIVSMHWLRQESGSTRESAADTLDLHQVGNGVCGCVQWQRVLSTEVVQAACRPLL